MDLSLFRGFSGRLPRHRWWLGMVILALAELIVLAFLFWMGKTYGTDVSDPEIPYSFAYEMVPGSISSIVFSVVMLAAGLLLLWAALTLHAKRWHDRDKSGWWTLIVFLPVIGFIWMLVELGFLKGTPGPNRFGDSPSGPVS